MRVCWMMNEGEVRECKFVAVARLSFRPPTLTLSGK